MERAGNITRNGTIGTVLANWEDFNNAQLELVGLTLPGNRKYKVNLYSTSRVVCRARIEVVRRLRVREPAHGG